MFIACTTFIRLFQTLVWTCVVPVIQRVSAGLHSESLHFVVWRRNALPHEGGNIWFEIKVWFGWVGLEWRWANGSYLSTWPVIVGWWIQRNEAA